MVIKPAQAFRQEPASHSKGSCKRYYRKGRYKALIGTKHGFKVELRLTLCLASQHATHVPSAQHDSNSYQIAIDSCCSFSISKHRRDFIGELVPCNMKVQGFTGSSTVKWKGT